MQNFVHVVGCYIILLRPALTYSDTYHDVAPWGPKELVPGIIFVCALSVHSPELLQLLQKAHSPRVDMQHVSPDGSDAMAAAVCHKQGYSPLEVDIRPSYELQGTYQIPNPISQHQGLADGATCPFPVLFS